MSTRKGGLGRGLGALIPTDVPATGDGTSLREIPTGQIEPNQFQPREHFDEESLASLTASVRALGVLQPVLVRPTEDPDRFDLERRAEHQAFGAGGRHFCLGTALARLELKILMEESLARYPEMEIDGTPEYVLSPFVNQLKHLPVRLRP